MAYYYRPRPTCFSSTSGKPIDPRLLLLLLATELNERETISSRAFVTSGEGLEHSTLENCLLLLLLLVVVVKFTTLWRFPLTPLQSRRRQKQKFDQTHSCMNAWCKIQEKGLIDLPSA